jgi:hypothetical protein
MPIAQLCARHPRDALSQPLRELVLCVGALPTEVTAVAEGKLGVSLPMVIGLSVRHDILLDSGTQSVACPRKSPLRSAYAGPSVPRHREPWRQESSGLRGARGL